LVLQENQKEHFTIVSGFYAFWSATNERYFILWKYHNPRNSRALS